MSYRFQATVATLRVVAELEDRLAGKVDPDIGWLSLSVVQLGSELTYSFGGWRITITGSPEKPGFLITPEEPTVFVDGVVGSAVDFVNAGPLLRRHNFRPLFVDDFVLDLPHQVANPWY